MKKSDLDIQLENGLLMGIAIANGYAPMTQKNYDREFNKRMRNCGIDNYREAFNYVYASMPQYVGDNAIYCGTLSLVKDDKSIDFALGNLQQKIDEFTNVPRDIVSEFVQTHDIENIPVEEVIKTKENLYKFFKNYVAPEMYRERLEILNENISKNNTLKALGEKDIYGTLFEYKFTAFNRMDHSRGNKDYKFYRMVHSIIDANIDFISSVLNAQSEKDVDLRTIAPYGNIQKGIKYNQSNFELV